MIEAPHSTRFWALGKLRLYNQGEIEALTASARQAEAELAAARREVESLRRVNQELGEESGRPDLARQIEKLVKHNQGLLRHCERLRSRLRKYEAQDAETTIS